MSDDHSARIDELAERARRDRERFDPPEDPPDPDRAMEFLREGFGQAVLVYVDGRTDGWVRFGEEEFERLEAAMNEWLELYAECFGREITAEFTVREAAELLLETHNIRDVAQLLTHVPARHGDGTDPSGR